MKSTHVFGLHAVNSVLRNRPDSVIKLLLSDNRNDKRLLQLEALAEQSGVEIERVSGKELQRQYGEYRHQGVVAQCKVREVLSEPELLNLVTTCLLYTSPSPRDRG